MDSSDTPSLQPSGIVTIEHLPTELHVKILSELKTLNDLNAIGMMNKHFAAVRALVCSNVVRLVIRDPTVPNSPSDRLLRRCEMEAMAQPSEVIHNESAGLTPDKILVLECTLTDPSFLNRFVYPLSAELFPSVTQLIILQQVMFHRINLDATFYAYFPLYAITCLLLPQLTVIKIISYHKLLQRGLTLMFDEFLSKLPHCNRLAHLSIFCRIESDPIPVLNRPLVNLQELYIVGHLGSWHLPNIVQWLPKLRRLHFSPLRLADFEETLNHILSSNLVHLNTGKLNIQKWPLEDRPHIEGMIRRRFPLLQSWNGKQVLPHPNDGNLLQLL